MGPDIAGNPYVQGMGDVIQRRLQENLQENLLPSISRGARSAGQYGGTRQGVAQGIALKGTQQAYGDALAQLQSEAYGQGLEQQARGMALAPQTMQQGLLPSQLIGQVGAERRALDQAGIDEEMARHYYAQEEPWQRVERYNALASGIPWGSSQTSETSGGGSNTAGSALGGALTGVGTAQYLSGAGAGLFGGTPTFAGLGAAGTLGLYGLGGALLGGLFG
jgi:hypothetical protein